MALMMWMMALLCVLSRFCTADSDQKCSAERTIEKATSNSCFEVYKTDSTLQCFAACLSTITHFYSFSRSRDTRSCYCCQNPPSNNASVVPDQGLTSYKTFSCADAYTPVVLSGSRHCWRYEVNPANYETARSYCMGDGGNIIIINSQEKQDKFQEFVVSHNSGISQVWIQARRHNGTWIYDDGTYLTYFNFAAPPDGDNGDPDNDRMRTRSEFGFRWGDRRDRAQFEFVCEVNI